MKNFDLTNEEIEALRYYKNMQYEAINQLLVSNGETDIALLSDEVEGRAVPISYDKESVERNLETIKKVYELMLKLYYQNKKTEEWTFTRGTNIAEIERLKNELYIDKFLSTTQNELKAQNDFASIWNRPAVIHLHGKADIPYVSIDEVLGKQNEQEEVLIAPFTRIMEIKDEGEIALENSAKVVRSYSIQLEKQELEEFSEEERNGLYEYIIDNTTSINRRLKECIELEKENAMHYENMRKLEQLLSKYEINAERKESEKDYTDSQQKADFDDIQRINKELDELKTITAEIYQIRRSHIDFVTNWKKNIAVYMMAECRELELKYIALNEVVEEENKKRLEQEAIKKEKEELEQERLETLKEKVREERINQRSEGYRELFEGVKQQSQENIEQTEKLLENIQNLITKQQNHAKIAGNLGASYSALNNAFEMRKVAENLQELIQAIETKIMNIDEIEDQTLALEKLQSIYTVNLQISTLMNYLNNPKIAVKNSKATRFDEMAIIEENELKRGIAIRIRDICGEAELKKLKDDLEMLTDKGAISKFFGIFTGKNKLDDFMIEQIDIRQKAIRRTLSRKMSLAHNYSIHDFIAYIRMFVEDNNDDELVEEDVGDLEALEEELKRNFVILDSKVRDLIAEKEGRNLPIQDKKLSKRELIEIETYRFLHKYGYDIVKEEKEPTYQDTTANEISRIVEYINSSNVLNL